MRPFAVVCVMSVALGLTVPSCSTQRGDTAGGSGTVATQRQPSHVGDTINLNRNDGGTVAVTLNRIIEPVTVVGGKGDPALKYLAAELTITDTGDIEVEGSVIVNVTLGGSDNQTYRADLNDVTECVNFDEGTFHLAPGESTTGCVVFAIPPKTSPASVRYTPSAGFDDDHGEWLIH